MRHLELIEGHLPVPLYQRQCEIDDQRGGVACWLTRGSILAVPAPKSQTPALAVPLLGDLGFPARIERAGPLNQNLDRRVAW